MQIQQRLDDWCAAMGYKDGGVNLLSLSHSIHISKDDLTLFFRSVFEHYVPNMAERHPLCGSQEDDDRKP